MKIVAKLKKIFSWNFLFEKLMIVLKRFPLSIASCLTVAVVGIILVENEDNELLRRILLIGILAAFSLTALKIWLENTKYSTVVKYSLFFLAGILLLVYYLTFPEKINQWQEIHWWRYVALNFTAIVAIFLAPFFSQNKSWLWHYNFTIVEKFAFAFTSGATLFIGLSLSLLSVDFLFGIKVEYNLYFKLWIFLAAFVSPLIFLAAIPQDWKVFENKTKKPKWIMIFSFAILLPLLAFYLLILYIYGIKIIATQTWPKGTVAQMILGYATIGTIAMLIIDVFRKEIAKTRLISRVFYGSLVPLVILLFAGLYQRVNPYGWTFPRALIVVLGVWFLVLAFYFLFSRKQNLKFIHASLIVFVLFSFFAPCNIFNFSAKDQFNRLKVLLESKNVLVGNKINNKKDEFRSISEGEYRTIRTQLEVLNKAGQISLVHPWLEVVPTVENNSRYNRNQVLSIFEAFGFNEDDFISYYNPQRQEEYSNINFYFKDSLGYPLPKINDAILLTDLYSNKLDSEGVVENNMNPYVLFHDKNKLYLKKRNEGKLELIAQVDLNDLINSLWGSGTRDITPEDAVLEMKSEGHKTFCLIKSIEIEESREEKEKSIVFIDALIVLGEM
ncbi:MAG TPA: DUF4153 domain-containing protein [Candidatus Moranbacteria bacterium]|nr:DUF4153 domain-containing protein [Candidatus Moranbacteria bacterium]